MAMVLCFRVRGRLCLSCGKPLPTLAPASRKYCGDACRNRHHRSTESVGPNGGATVASVPFMITRQMRADLRQRGVHPDVIRELRPEDAHRLLDENEPVPPNAERSPQHDLRKLAAVLAGQDSGAARARCDAPRPRGRRDHS